MASTILRLCGHSRSVGLTALTVAILALFLSVTPSTPARALDYLPCASVQGAQDYGGQCKIEPASAAQCSALANLGGILSHNTVTGDEICYFARPIAPARAPAISVASDAALARAEARMAAARPAESPYQRSLGISTNALSMGFNYMAQQAADREQAAAQQAADDAAQEAEAAQARQAAADADAAHRGGLSNPFGTDQQATATANPFAPSAPAGGAANNPFQTASIPTQATLGSAPPNSSTCKEAKIGIVWVLQGDKGARATYARGRRRGLTPLEAVIFAQGHNPHAQAMIRGCSVSAQVVASLVGAG